MSSKKIVLTSSDGESFKVDEVVARRLQIIAHMIEDECADKAILLKSITGKTLALVIEYCETHVDDDVAPDSSEGDIAAEEAKKKKLEDWDAEFKKNLDLDKIFDLLLAVNFLNVSGLLDLLCQAAADHIKDKTPEELREIFGLEDDLTAEDKAELYNEIPLINNLSDPKP